MRQIFLDTETTGLSPESGDRIIEVACVEFVNRRPSGRDKRYYVNPERASSEDAFKVHGIDDAFLATQPRFAEIVDELLEFIAGAEVVIHNAGFDEAFLDLELARAGRPALRSHVGTLTDSLAMARDAFPGKSNSLDALCRRFEVNNAERTLHGALLDARLLAEVYVRMTRGQESLVIDAADALDAEDALRPIDFASLDLVVIAADAAERAAHAATLAAIAKASGGKLVWRDAEAIDA